MDPLGCTRWYPVTDPEPHTTQPQQYLSQPTRRTYAGSNQAGRDHHHGTSPAASSSQEQVGGELGELLSKLRAEHETEISQAHVDQISEKDELTRTYKRKIADVVSRHKHELQQKKAIENEELWSFDESSKKEEDEKQTSINGLPSTGLGGEQLRSIQNEYEGSLQAMKERSDLQYIDLCDKHHDSYVHQKSKFEKVQAELISRRSGEMAEASKRHKVQLSELRKRQEIELKLLQYVPTSSNMSYLTWDKSSTKLEWHGILHKNMSRWNTEEMKDLTGVTPEMIDSLKDVKWDNPNLPGQFVHDQEIRIDANETNRGTRAALAYRRDPSDGTISCLYVLVTVKFRLDTEGWVQHALQSVGLTGRDEITAQMLSRLGIGRPDSPVYRLWKQAAMKLMGRGVEEVIDEIFTQNGFSC